MYASSQAHLQTRSHRNVIAQYQFEDRSLQWHSAHPHDHSIDAEFLTGCCAWKPATLYMNIECFWLLDMAFLAVKPGQVGLLVLVVSFG